ncbi:MAG: UPF0262 family protein [Rhodospirillales bacterium]|nr:UPF0262 family protein [Rhodospirillales bacterium]
MTTAAIRGGDRLVRVLLGGDALPRLSPLKEADRAQAVADLAAENRFAPAHHAWDQTAPPAGPYVLHLAIQDGRLVFDIRTAEEAPVAGIGLALGPFRALMKDYEMLVDSYALAVAEGREARIQAIDMGRRGLHDEGARLLMARLAGKIEIDFPTARRLFTLVCVLHQRG